MNQAAQVGERGAAPEPPRQDSRKVIYAAIVANLGIAIAKFIVAGVTGSAAMVAEGIHSAVDTGNELLLLLGERRSARKPDRKHPFGYGKTLYFWALIVALSVFSLGGGLSIYHGVAALQDPPPLEDPLWNYVVLGAAALFEGYSWNVSRKALNAKRGPGMTLWQTVRASKDASVFTVFIEDSAALLGIAIAAAGIAVGHYLDNPYADPVASILIGVLQTFAVALDYSLMSLLNALGANITAATPGYDILKLTIAQSSAIMPFLLLVLILIFRPKGLMGTRE